MSRLAILKFDTEGSWKDSMLTASMACLHLVPPSCDAAVRNAGEEEQKPSKKVSVRRCFGLFMVEPFDPTLKLTGVFTERSTKKCLKT